MMEELCTCGSLPLVGHCPGGVGPEHTASLSLLPFLMPLFLYIFRGAKVDRLAFGLFSESVTLYEIAALLCPWGELNSGFPYSAIRIPHPGHTFLILMKSKFSVLLSWIVLLAVYIYFLRFMYFIVFIIFIVFITFILYLLLYLCIHVFTSE